MHLKDIVPWNVKVAFEAHSNPAFATLPDLVEPGLSTQGVCRFGDLGNVTDQYDNVRPDGSKNGIYVHRSETQNHCEVTMHDGLAVLGMVDYIKEKGLP